MLWRENSKLDWQDRPATACSMLKFMECPAFEQADKQQILDVVPDWKGKRVLDLAAGIGRFTGEFATLADRVTSVEWIPKFVEENQRRHTRFSNIEYLCEDAAIVDFAKSRFDLIFASFFFMYLTDEEMNTVASKIKKWLAPGGHVFLRESCESVRSGPTKSNPTIYRTLLEYDSLFCEYRLIKEGSVKAWIDYLSRPLVCYWVFEKQF